MNDRSNTEALDEVIASYDRAISEHGTEVGAVGWRTRAAQRRNFAAIARAFAHETEPFTVHEVGCGFGDLADFLRAHFPLASYRGSDLNPQMIALARQRDPSLQVEHCNILERVPEPADYVVESGIFNWRGGHTDAEWQQMVESVLLAMWGFARKGIAANFLTAHVEWRRDFAYHQDPAALLNFAHGKLERFVKLDHAYYPWEFTLTVYRAPAPLPFCDQ